MWGLFFITLAAGAFFLFLPGSLVFRALRMPRVTSFVLAPLATVPLYEFVCIVYGKTGTFSTWANVFFPILLISLLAYALSRALAKRSGAAFLSDDRTLELLGRSFSVPSVCLVLTLVIGTVVGCVLFAGNLVTGPDSYEQAYDNIHHLGEVSSYLTMGNWSPLYTTLYEGSDASFATVPGGSFYPSGWHCVAALAASLTGAPATVAVNAANFLFAFVVYPAGMCLLLTTLFHDDLKAIVFGTIACLFFGAFPYYLLDFGPIYPNLAAFSLVPAYCACFMRLVSAERKPQPVYAIAFVLGSLCMLFLQPNGVFTAAVFLIPYCAYQAYLFGSRPRKDKAASRARGVRWMVGAIVLMALIWLACYKAPFLQSVVQHEWVAGRGLSDAIPSVALYRFGYGGIQPALTIVVFIGFVVSVRRPRYFWISATVLMAALIYVVDVRFNNTLQHLLGGFWYSDSVRIAAFVAMFSVPLAALGLSAVYEFVVKRLPRQRIAAKVPIAVFSLVSVCFIALAFFPWVPVNGSSSWLSNALQGRLSSIQFAYNENGQYIYNAAEQKFVKEVEEIIPSDAIVINEPNDGSAFAWAADGLRVYNRQMRNESAGETLDSGVIRQSLNRIADDRNVQQAVKDVGAQYVLQLDQGRTTGADRLWSYEGGTDWRGIDNITDTTPGFQLVLADGDMRLYKIVG